MNFKLVALLTCLGILQSTMAQKKDATMESFNYDKAWTEVQEFESKLLPASALKVVDDIYAHAKADKNSAQLVKAIVHKLKFAQYTEDDAFSKSLTDLKSEAEGAEFPAKPLLHSMLGEMYWQYYQNNRYRFMNRTATAQFKNDDLATWTLADIVQATFREYEWSLKDASRTKAEKIEVFEPVINGGSHLGRQYRPTLYDFLASRALGFFRQEETSLARPAYAFTISIDEFLGDATTFLAQKIVSPDSLSMELRALQVFQDITAFHLKDTDPAAMVDIELDRLQYVRSKHTASNKNELYDKALDALIKKVQDNAAVGNVIEAKARLLMETAAQYKPLQGDEHKWDLKKAYALCDEAGKHFPESDGSIRCENVLVDIRSKSVDAKIEENNLPNEPFRCLVSYKNFTSLYYRIIKTTREDVRAVRRKLERKYYDDREAKFLEHFLPLPVTKQGSFTLPDDGDYQQHQLEVKLDALPEGEYMVLLSTTPDFSLEKNSLSYAFTVVSNIAYINRSLPDGSTEFFMLHRKTGEPLSGVKATAFRQRYNSSKGGYEPVNIGDYLSDGKGYFRIPYMKNNDSRYFILNFVKGNDFQSTEGIDNQYNYYTSSIYQYKQEPYGTRTQTFFFLDRGIYRPGQTIYFKGLVVDTDGKKPVIKTNYASTVRLYDVNGQEQGVLELRTNDYGTFSGTFVAPSTGLTGSMRLHTDDQSGETYFSVEEYKRPKFEVTFEPVKGIFKLEEAIAAEGKAAAYSGAMIDGAKVTYRVVREANFPYWWWCRWGYYPSSPQVEISHGETVSDAQGKFVVKFSAQPDKSVDRSSDPTFNYTVYADVTDINGETHSSSTSIRVGYKALLVSVDVNTINLDADDKKEYTINTRNLAGEFEPASGVIKIFQLTSPSRAYRNRLWERPDRQLYTRDVFESYFPNDLYQDENNRFTWAREKEVLNLNFNTATQKTFTLADIKKWTAGEYVLEITSHDKYNQEVKEVTYFRVFSPLAKHVVTSQIDYVQPIVMQAEPGNNASFLMGSSAKVSVLYELELDGVLLSANRLSLDNEQRTFSVPVLEQHRGNIGVHVTFIKNNRLYVYNSVITVPFTNKELDVTFETFRDKIQPGQKEQWRIKVKGKNADKIAAEMVATLYDESLDQFASNDWFASFYGSFYNRLGWASVHDYQSLSLSTSYRDWNPGYNRSPSSIYFDSFNWFGFNYYSHRYGAVLRSRVAGMATMSAPAPMEQDKAELAEVVVEGNAMKKEARDGEAKKDSISGDVKPEPNKAKNEDFGAVKVRSNFNETAFFYPHLMTNENGEIIINFTVPEALTRWKMLGFAHTQDLKSGFVRNKLVTQKDLMVVPNQPRFFRDGDTMSFSTKITSLSDKPLNGQVQLQFFDALTMIPIDTQMKVSPAVKDFSLQPKQSTAVEWSIFIPEGLQAIMYRVVAKAGEFSDGEEMVIPVVTNRMMVTETMPLPIRGKQTKTFTFDKLVNTKSTTLRHQGFALEFTSNPAWYAIQSLPYLMEYPYECVEQTFSRYYANSIATHIANSNPRIKQVFDTWRNIQPDALLSNLEKNQELKTALLEETPWVFQATNERERKRMVGVLFDLNRMSHEMDRAFDKVAKAQQSSGGFSWFPGFPEDRYMTQHIVAGLGHLGSMGITYTEQSHSLATEAIRFLDDRIVRDYEDLKEAARKKYIKMEDNNIGYIQYHYLYARSYFTETPVPTETKEAFDYFKGQAAKYWTSTGLYMQGMTCLALHRLGDKTTPAAMIKSFNERAIRNEEMGMYWKYEGGFYWYQAPIETHALMIEVYDEVTGDNKPVDDLKTWLLKQKQTQDWGTTKATVEACYALLRRGTDALASNKLVNIKVGNETVDPSHGEDAKVEAGTGYFKKSWKTAEVKSDMGKITISKSDDGVAWGAAYWQYSEQLDKITPAATPLSLKKALFLQTNSDNGPVITPITDHTALKVGDLVKVRIELRSDRDLEYVHLKDMRAAGFEPVSTLSTYKYQDGLYYYESPRDLATNFFIGWLPKGVFVFEYALRVSQKGDFSNGITTIQCMYAPEFTSHSAGIRVNIK